MPLRLATRKYFLVASVLLPAASIDARAAAKSTVWPFDQRQIALVKAEDQAFPDDATAAQIMDTFVARGRVRWVTRKGGPGQVVALEVPRDFPWRQAASVRQLGEKFKVDGVLLLAQKGAQLNLQWYATADGQPLFFESLSLPQAGPREGEVEMRRKRLRDWLADIWDKIPGQGYVVNRDLTTLTLEGAAQVGLKAGDTVELRRLQEMERHPLLKTLVQIRSSVTGRAVIKDVGNPFAVAKVDYESQVDPIQEGDRYAVVTVVRAPVVTPPPQDPPRKDAKKKVSKDAARDGRSYIPLFGSDREKNESAVSAKPDENPAAKTSDSPDSKAGDQGSSPTGEKKSDESSPDATAASEDPDAGPDFVSPLHKVLDVEGGLILGSLRHQENVVGAAYDVKAFAPGVKVAAKFYVTRPVILYGDVTYLFPRFSNAPAIYQSSTLTGSYSSTGLGVGYRFIFGEELPFPGEVDLSLGYRRASLSFSQNSSPVFPTSKVYVGYELGVGLQLAVPPQMALFVKGSRVLGTRVTESPVTSGDAPTNLVWHFEGGLRYKLSEPSQVSASLGFESVSTNFSGVTSGDGARATQALSSVLNATLFMSTYTYQF